MTTISYKTISLLLVFACVLGARLISIDVSAFAISPYRIIFPLSILLIPGFYLTAFNLQVIKEYSYVRVLLLMTFYSICISPFYINYGSYLQYLLFIINGVIITVIIFAYIDDFNILKRLLKTLVFLSAIFSIVGIKEMITAEYNYVSESDQLYYSVFSHADGLFGFAIPVSVFGNPNNLSLFLIFSISFCFIIFLTSKRVVEKLVILATSITLIFVLFSTSSRSGVMSLLIFLSSLLIFGFISKRKNYKIASIIIGTLLFIILILNLESIYNIYTKQFEISVDDNLANSETTRKNLILNAIDILLYKSYLFGVGPGQFEELMSISINQKHYVGSVINLHNFWVEILVSYGLIFFLYFIFIYFKTLLKSYSNILHHESREASGINLIVCCLLISFPVAAIGPSNVFMNEWTWPLIALMMKIPFIRKPISSSNS